MAAAKIMGFQCTENGFLQQKNFLPKWKTNGINGQNGSKQAVDNGKATNGRKRKGR
jgi:hypothetical protein